MICTLNNPARQAQPAELSLTKWAWGFSRQCMICLSYSIYTMSHPWLSAPSQACARGLSVEFLEMPQDALHCIACQSVTPQPKQSQWGIAYLRFSVPISTLAMNPKVVLRKEYKGSFGGWSTEMISMGLTLPLQSACAARTGVHIPVLADRPLPVPVGIRQRGTLIASCQSSRLNKPCSRALDQANA